MKRLAILTVLLLVVFLVGAGSAPACDWISFYDPCCCYSPPCCPCWDPCWPCYSYGWYPEPAPVVIGAVPPPYAVPFVAAPAAGQATLTLALPRDARLMVNDEATAVTSSRPVFTAPDLKAGQKYTYTLTATITRDGKTRSVSRQVVVRAGDNVQVNLSPVEDKTPAVARAPAGSQASLTLALPRDARLTVNDEPTAVTSDRPTFIAPGLKPGQKYAYALKATFTRGGKLQTVTRRVTIRAGDKVQVDLTTPAVATAAR
ncbi:MAG TPA: TIGR03000 domain-containing protein [Gemmataceae bacterium]|jgi:uncharacterized protein (TIGR03000 family)|nr:TIGR03000 domain-containing protein [Gemmataceae bacterium]